MRSFISARTHFRPCALENVHAYIRAPALYLGTLELRQKQQLTHQLKVM